MYINVLLKHGSIIMHVSFILNVFLKKKKTEYFFFKKKKKKKRRKKSF